MQNPNPQTSALQTLKWTLALSASFGLLGCFGESSEPYSESVVSSSSTTLSSSLGQSSQALSSSATPLSWTQDLESQAWTNTLFSYEIEGPAVDAQGNFYAVNIDDPEAYNEFAAIGKITPSSDGSTGTGQVLVRMPQFAKINGLRFNRDFSLLYIAEYDNHTVLRYRMADAKLDTLVANPNFNQPNDLAIMDNDILLASDPDWSTKKGQIWRVLPNGQATKLDSNIGTTNGIEVSPDNRTLYVGESVQRQIWAYDLSAAGEISNRRLLIEFPDFGLDGMRTDVHGNLYVTRFGKGTVAVISPTGQLLQEIKIQGKNPTNLTFGGPDGRTVYVTVQDLARVESFRAQTAGREFAMAR